MTSYTLVRVWTRLPPRAEIGGDEAADLPPPPGGVAQEAFWRGALVLADGGVLHAVLAPDPSLLRVTPERRRELAPVLDLEERSGLRLYLTYEVPAGAATGAAAGTDSQAAAPPARTARLHVRSARVRDAAGLAARDLRDVLAAGSAGSPGGAGIEALGSLLNLLAHPEATVAPGNAAQRTLLGRLPGDGAEVVLDTDRGERVVPLAPVADPPGPHPPLDLPGWYRRAEEPPQAADTGTAEEVARLETALEQERRRVAELEERARARELEFLEFQRALSRVDVGALERWRLAEEAEEPPPAEAGPGPAPEPEPPSRVDEIETALRALLRLEGIYGLDLLDAGELHRGDAGGAVGPVVFRTLDGRGRLSGGLFAERLWLEASRAARTLTLVLEDGYESHGGVRTPFVHGVRRITFPFVEPEPWLRDVPELFSRGDLDPPNDDGVWNLAKLREGLNELLALEVSGGWFRVHSLGGVLGDELVQVHVEEHAPDGPIRRRLFADRMRIHLDGSVRLVLVDGASLRGSEKREFAGGRHEIFLPRAPLDAWRAAWDAGELPVVEPAGSEEPGDGVEPGGGARPTEGAGSPSPNDER